MVRYHGNMKQLRKAQLFYVLLAVAASAMVLVFIIIRGAGSNTENTVLKNEAEYESQIVSSAEQNTQAAPDSPSATEPTLDTQEQEPKPKKTTETVTEEPQFSTQQKATADAETRTETPTTATTAAEGGVLQSALSLEEQDTILQAHNVAREARDIKPLSWSQSLAESAQAWADHLQTESCAWYHSDTTTQGVGENIFYSWSSDNTFRRNAEEPVVWWLNKEQFYDHENNECDPGKVCGHYTQVVWEDTAQLGCGRVYCDGSGYVKEVWVCQYDPPGNVVGQKPY